MSTSRTANLAATLASAIVDRMERQKKRHANETSSAAAALNVIGYYEGCSNGELGRTIGLSHTATVRLVDKLEAAGLVVSSPAIDKRAVALRLTPLGRKRAKLASHDRFAEVERLIDVLSRDQRRQLDAIAEAMLRAMVTTAQDADRMCRLCDIVACPPNQCPVHQKALKLEGTPAGDR